MSHHGSSTVKNYLFLVIRPFSFSDLVSFIFFFFVNSVDKERYDYHDMIVESIEMVCNAFFYSCSLFLSTSNIDTFVGLFTGIVKIPALNLILQSSKFNDWHTEVGRSQLLSYVENKLGEEDCNDNLKYKRIASYQFNSCINKAEYGKLSLRRYGKLLNISNNSVDKYEARNKLPNCLDPSNPKHLWERRTTNISNSNILLSLAHSFHSSFYTIFSNMTVFSE